MSDRELKVADDRLSRREGVFTSRRTWIGFVGMLVVMGGVVAVVSWWAG